MKISAAEIRKAKKLYAKAYNLKPNEIRAVISQNPDIPGISFFRIADNKFLGFHAKGEPTDLP